MGLSVLLAFALRVYGLTRQSLWLDEGWSIFVARHPLAQIIPLIVVPGRTHPPLYYYSLHLWTALAGFSELAVRYLSVVYGLLLVAAGGRLARELFDRPTALLAMAALALVPVHVAYAQEARMYTLIALLYPLCLILVHRLLRPAVGPEGGLSRLGWVGLAVVEIAMLYTHYMAVFVLGYLNALMLGWLGLSQRWEALKRWLGVQAVVALAVSPWVGAAVLQMGEHQPEAAGPPGLVAFVADTWHFFNAGVLGAASTAPAFAALSTALAVTLAGALLVLMRARLSPWHASPPSVRRTGWHRGATNPGLTAGTGCRDGQAGASADALLLAHTLVPLAGVFALAQFRPGLHPRYVMLLATPLYVLAARAIRVLAWGRPWQRPLGVVLALLLGGTFLLGLDLLYFDPRFQKDDVRSVAAYLAKTAGPDDIILFDYPDQAFDYYYRGAAPVHILEVGEKEAADVALALAEVVQGGGQVFTVKWRQGQTDRRGAIPFLLELSGRLGDEEVFPGFWVRRYALERPMRAPELTPIAADFGPVQVTGVFYETAAPADNAVAVAIRWRLSQMTRLLAAHGERHFQSQASEQTRQMTQRAYKTAIVLRDGAGREIARDDRFLLDGHGRPTSAWGPGSEATTYHVLPIPIGTAPLTYTLAVGVYDETNLAGLDLRDAVGAPAGKRAVLGEVRLTPARNFDHDPYRTWPGLGLTPPAMQHAAEGLELVGARVEPLRAGPGQRLAVLLAWRATGASRPAYVPRLRLVQGDVTVAEVAQAPVDGRYPTDTWVTGEVVLDRRELVIPPMAQNGPARLELLVAGEGPAILLAEVQVDVTARTFAPPPMQYQINATFGGVAQLIGYDLDRTQATPQDTVTLTLYWRAVNAEAIGTSYTVFAHLLDRDGRLIGQHDGPPAGGARPTTGWVQGEVITDVHPMTFKDTSYAGPAVIEVGLYDPATGQRLTMGTGEDHFLLPTPVEVR